jgi:nucleoid-associated protein YgaU
MTRETRIGLLVGLGFIVLFGVALSGLLNNKPPTSDASSGNSSLAYDSGREEVASPKPETPTVAIRSSEPPVVPPAEPVRTVASAGPPSEVVVGIEPPGDRIASAGGPAASEIVRGHDDLMTPPLRPVPVLPAGGPADASAIADASMDRGAIGSTRVASIDRIPALKYKIVAGDTLGKLAAKFYGHSTDYKLILTANASLKEATSLKIGQEIVIPPSPVRTAVARAAPGAYTPIASCLPPAPVTGAPASPAAIPSPALGPVRTVDATSLRRVLAGATRGADHAVAPAPGTAAADGRSGAVVTDADSPAPTTGAQIADRMRARMDLSGAFGPASHPADPAPSPGPVSAPKKIYKIQVGDTLTKIASKMMNDTSRASIQKIIDLNKGKISSPESLKVGVTLDIPS